VTPDQLEDVARRLRFGQRERRIAEAMGEGITVEDVRRVRARVRQLAKAPQVEDAAAVDLANMTGDYLSKFSPGNCRAPGCLRTNDKPVVTMKTTEQETIRAVLAASARVRALTQTGPAPAVTPAPSLASTLGARVDAATDDGWRHDGRSIPTISELQAKAADAAQVRWREGSDMPGSRQ
jgi:hypothetical protein